MLHLHIFIYSFSFIFPQRKKKNKNNKIKTKKIKNNYLVNTIHKFYVYSAKSIYVMFVSCMYMYSIAYAILGDGDGMAAM